jgi:glycosyltransferase involved in cell wall biosynthesis
MRAPIFYAPPGPILKLGEAAAKRAGRWPATLVAAHEQRYGPAYKASLRARNALYFADLFLRRGIGHFHVHFANRAAHTAIFVEAISGIPFSISTHGQDFMSDLGNDDLLREICREAEFVANETNFSKDLVAKTCPNSAGKMHRVFNGMDMANFPAPTAVTSNPVVRIVSTGRLIEFKGFHHLIAACDRLRERGLSFACEIIGEGPWRARLQEQIEGLGLQAQVRLAGSLPQEEVFAALRGCDIFALACTRDQAGASDVFPTVILEAMASAKPVVSTRLAGVPEQIVEGESGLLVDAGDEIGLAEALRELIASPERRQELGQGARARLEQEFSVEQTVRPLQKLFAEFARPAAAAAARAPAGMACLLEQWPPSEAEVREFEQWRQVRPNLRLFVLGVSSAGPENLAGLLGSCDFLPDGMVQEGEWQQERALARQMETWRVELGEKISSESFLHSARQALALRELVAEAGIRHLHALSPRELLTGWVLRRLCSLSLSVTLEGKGPAEGEEAPERLLAACTGIYCTWAEKRVAEIPAEIRARLVPGKPGRPLPEAWLQTVSA